MKDKFTMLAMLLLVAIIFYLFYELISSRSDMKALTECQELHQRHLNMMEGYV